MKVGLGLFRDSLTKDNFQFARQAGVTHLVVHLVDYFRGKHPHLTSGEPETGLGDYQRQTLDISGITRHQGHD